MNNSSVKLGFVPGDRPVFSTAWALRMRDRCVTALRGLAGVELILPDHAITTQGLVRSIVQAEAVAEQFRKAGVQRLLLGTMNFGDEEAMSEVARRLGVPVLLFGTPDAVLSNGKRAGSDSFCGTLSVSYNLHAAGVPFSFAGIVDPGDPAFAARMREFVSASPQSLLHGYTSGFDKDYAPPANPAKSKAGTAAAADFREARLGQFGPRAGGFTTCAFDERQLLRQFGQRVVPVDLAAVFGRANRLTDSDPQVRAASERFSTQTTLEVGAVTLSKMSRLYVALHGLIAEHRLRALGHNCWTSIQSEYGISGCAVFSFLEEDGWPIACETDVYGAASLLLQQCVAKQLGQNQRPFFMDWTVQHETDKDLFQAWHCGKAPLSTFKSKPAVRAHEILGPLLGDDVSGGTLEGPLREGPVTLVRLAEHGGKFRALVTRGVIEPSPWPAMRGSWGWVRVPGLERLYRLLVEKGFSHHVSMIHGDHTTETVAACEALGMEVVWFG